MHEKKRYDVRVVRMAKSTREFPFLSMLHSMKNNKRKNAYVCIGHFDVIAIDELDVSNGKSLLRSVQDDCNKSWNIKSISRGYIDTSDPKSYLEENYCYPLYLLKQLEHNDSSGDNQIRSSFWESETCFLGVTRFHQYRTSGENTGTRVNFLDELTERLNAYGNDNPNDTGKGVQESNDYYVKVNVKVDNNTCPVWCVFYDTLELGDVVSIFKSDSLAAILKVQRYLYEFSEVNDAYSYCGMNYRLFLPNDGEPTEKVLNTAGMKQRFLDYASSRFSVNNASQADEIFKMLGDGEDNGYYVPGNVDSIINYAKGKRISEYDFVEKMKIIAACGDKVYVAFNDVISRVGLKNHEPVESRPIPQADENNSHETSAKNEEDESHKTNPESHEDILKPEMLKWLSGEMVSTNGESGNIYAHSLNKMYCTLQTMKKNCLLDDLSDLLSAGVDALINRLTYLYDKGEWHYDYSDELQEFLDYWTVLTNAILHLESQLAQHLELMPVRYYIPAMILQFEQNIVTRCAKIISKMENLNASQESHKTTKFIPIIFPCSQRETTTKAVLDPKHDISYGEKCPLCIKIPIHKLYSPWEISHVLCHEIAHYCGNTLRKRKQRFDCLINSLADYLLNLWDMVLDLPDEVSNKIDFSGCRNYISEYIRINYPLVLNDDLFFLDDVKRGLIESVSKVAKSEEIQNSVLMAYMRELSPSMQLVVANNSALDSISVGSELIDYIKYHLESCLLPLYKECFADIMMICLLNCSFEDYYECVYKREYDTYFKKAETLLEPEEVYSMKSWYEHHTDRMALVILSITSVDKYENWCRGVSFGTDWINSALNKVNSWKKNKEKWTACYLDGIFTSIRLLGYEADQLIKYLSECVRDICERLYSNNDLINGINTLRDITEYLKEEKFDWKELQKHLLENKI